MRNSQKIIGKALEDIPKILEVLSESFEEEDSSIVKEKGTFFCSEHLNPLEFERSSWDLCAIPCCVVCSLKEQGVIYTAERIKESPARDLVVDVVQGARETELNHSGTKTFPCSKHKRRDTSSKDVEVSHTTFSSFKNKKENLLTDGSHNQEEGKEDQSLTASKTKARKSSIFQPSTQDENTLRCLEIENKIGHKINSNVHKNTLEEDSKLDATVPDRYPQVLDDLSQLSAIEKFSSVLQSVMEGIENCSDLATNLTRDAPNLAANPTEMSDEFSSQDAMMTNYSSFTFGENCIGNSFKEMKAPPTENSVKIFDFAAEESERVTEHPEVMDSDCFGERDFKKEEELQIDVDAEFSNDNTDKIDKSKFERNFKSKELKIVEPIDTAGNNGGSHRGSSSSTADLNNGKESSMQKQNGVRRNKSTKTDRGFKFFKKKIFSKSMKGGPTKNDISVGKGSPSWKSFDGIGSTTEELAKEDDGKNVICNCDAPNRITELENTIKLLEKERSNLEGEKLDLMNALSNIWIEMEDLKISFENQGNMGIEKPLKEDKTTMASLQEIDHDEDTSDVNMNKTSSSFKRMSKSEESCPQITQEEPPSEVDRENQIKALTKTKSLQSETLQSLGIKLSVVNEDKENLSRKLNEMFEKNKALEEKLQMVSGKTKQELDKILEENISFRSRLESLSSDKLLLEKNNKKLKIEKKKHKLMKLQIQKRCDNLIRKINEVIQTTHAGQVDEVPCKPKDKPASPRKLNNSSFEKFSTPEESLIVDKEDNSVQQIVRKLERTKSIDLTEVRSREKVMKGVASRDERGERAPATVRRAETLNSKAVNSDLTDGKMKEMKVNRFPPSQSSRGDKIRKDLKSSSGNEISFRSTVPSDTRGPSPKSVTVKEEDPCLKFFDHLEAKCVLLLERFTVLNGRVEWLERNGDIYDSMSPQGMCESTQSLQDEPASFDNVPAQNNPKKDAVLLSCLMNLQKENDNLKLDNLKYKALVANMQEKWSEGLSERIEDEITAEKNSIQRAEKDLHDLELRVVPERDVGLLENMAEIDDRSGEKDFLNVTKTRGSRTEDSGEARMDLNNSNNDVSANHLEEDISSWHRKHSKKSKESAKALVQNERVPMKIRQATSLERLPNLQDTYPTKIEGDINPIHDDRQANGKHILRALSLDESKALGSRLTHQPAHPATNEANKSPGNGLQRHDQDEIIAFNNVPNDELALNSQTRCCKSSNINGHHHEHCSSIVPCLRTRTLVDEATDAPPKPRENNKTLKKAMSTYGSRDRPYKVHYV